jgi:SAM-dependent methyltransferase
MKSLRELLKSLRNFDSKKYWQKRYSAGGNSGDGSYGKLADWKSSALNDYIASRNIQGVLEFGCGDGNNLVAIRAATYIGTDPSPAAIKSCISRFKGDSTKSFFCLDPDAFQNNGALVSELTLSMEVILHLVEDARYEMYMHNLFQAADKSVGIFNVATEVNDPKMGPHNRFRDHRPFVSANYPAWTEVEVKTAPSEIGFAEHTAFFFYERR